MSRGQDDIIDDAVVAIHPDLSTFQAELKAALEKQQALKKQPTYKVRVVAVGAGLKKSVAEAVKAQMLLKDQPVYKVKVVADAKGLKKSIGDLGDTTTKAAKKTEQDLTKAHAAAVRERRKADQKALAEGMAYALKLQFKAIEKNLDRVRNASEKHQRDEFSAREAEYKRENTRLRSLAEKAEKDRADAEIADHKRTNTRLRNELEKNEKDLADAQLADHKRTNSRLRNDDEKNQKERADAEVADLRRTNTRLRNEIEKNEKERADALVEDRKRTNTRVRNEDEQNSRLIEQARAADDARNLQRARNAEEARVADHLRALDLMNRDEERAAAERTKILKAEEKRRKESLAPFSKGQKLIDLGGEGLKPMSVLYGIVAAMTPALFAMGASALQASTSIAALGAAGIGAALGIGAIAIAFNGIGDLFSLRKSVQNEAATKAANSARDAVRSADELAQAKRNLADAQRDEKRANEDIHKARREAIRDLEDLRIAVRDLDNEYKSNALSVAEKKQDAAAADRNFFATALDKARAHQDVADAQTQLADTGLQRKRKKEDLQQSVSKGVEGSDKVRDAKERIRDARDRTLNAQDALRKGATGLGGGLDKTSSAAAQLAKKIKELAPAAREMYYWFLENEKLFKRLQKSIAQATLPGFNTFLKAITEKPKGGSSTLEIAARYAGELGAIIGEHIGEFGEFTQGPLFRGSMARIQKTNAAAFDKLGDALIKLADPITRILDKASPAFGAFADKVLELSTRFADFIENADKDGSLAKWFEDSRIEAKKWYDIATNIGTLLKNLFTGALPAGGSLVADFQTFTKSLADWSSSPEGTKQIKDFFDKIKSLPYAKIIDFLKNAVIFFAAYRTFTLLKGINPIFALLGAVAAAHPAEFASAFNLFATAVGKAIGFFADNPKAAAGLLALIAAAKVGKALGFSLTLPAMDRLQTALTSKFKFLDQFLGGGTKTGVMTVHAGVVNVYGAGGLPGTGGGGNGTPVTPGGGTDGKSKADPKKKPGGRIKDALRGKNLLGGLDKFIYVPLPLPETSGDVDDMINKFNKGQAKNNPNLRDKIQPVPKANTAKLINDEGFGLQRLENNLSSFGKDSPVTRDALNTYVAARQARVKEYVDYIRSTQGPVAAAKAQRAEDVRSQDTLSTLLQKYGWAKASAEIYTRQVFNLTEQTKKSKQANEDNQVSYDSMGNALDKTVTKTQALNTESKLLKDTINGLVGTHVIAFDTQGYDKVKKQLDLLYANQHVLYNPKYSNSAAGADSVSSQNQFLDPRTGLPKKYMEAAGGHIRGPGTGTSDSIPAWLSNGEYVMPAKTVDHYGLGVMEKMRRREYPGYAAGGPVMPFVVNLPTEGFNFPPAVTAPTPGGGHAVGNVQVAEIAEATARSMGATTKQLLALISAGIVESGLRNINYGDRDSVGFLQQRPSQGWGTVAQLLDPAYATRKFIQAARRMDKRNISAGELAARVQRPAAAYRSRYSERQADAAAVLNRFAPYINGGLQVGTPGAGGTKAGLIDFGRWLQLRGYDVSEHPAFGGVRGGHTSNSQHYRASAIDVNHGAGTSAREQAFLRKILPEAHRRGFRSIFMTTGHYNHAHFDLGRGHADGGLVRKYDNGGILPPGYSLAFNGTGQNETIRTDKQEKALGATRLDRRDLALLAQFMAGAVGSPTIAMDGRKVAETTNRYNYLPTGV